MKNTEILKTFKIPAWNQLPDLELYMDQVLTLINDTLAPLEDESMLLTKSMVNNYVKNSIVKPPQKKHYKRYHLAFLLVVSLLKPCFSLQEITEMIQIYTSLDTGHMDQDFDAFAGCYQRLLDQMVTTGTMEPFDPAGKSDALILMHSAIRTTVWHLVARKELETAICTLKAD